MCWISLVASDELLNPRDDHPDALHRLVRESLEQFVPGGRVEFHQELDRLLQRHRDLRASNGRYESSRKIWLLHRGDLSNDVVATLDEAARDAGALVIVWTRRLGDTARADKMRSNRISVVDVGHVHGLNVNALAKAAALLAGRLIDPLPPCVEEEISIFLTTEGDRGVQTPLVSAYDNLRKLASSSDTRTVHLRLLDDEPARENLESAVRELGVPVAESEDGADVLALVAQKSRDIEKNAILYRQRGDGRPLLCWIRVGTMTEALTHMSSPTVYLDGDCRVVITREAFLQEVQTLCSGGQQPAREPWGSRARSMQRAFYRTEEIDAQHLHRDYSGALAVVLATGKKKAVNRLREQLDKLATHGEKADVRKACEAADKLVGETAPGSNKPPVVLRTRVRALLIDHPPPVALWQIALSAVKNLEVDPLRIDINAKEAQWTETVESLWHDKLLTDPAGFANNRWQSSEIPVLLLEPRGGHTGKLSEPSDITKIPALQVLEAIRWSRASAPLAWFVPVVCPTRSRAPFLWERVKRLGARAIHKPLLPEAKKGATMLDQLNDALFSDEQGLLSGHGPQPDLYKLACHIGKDHWKSLRRNKEVSPCAILAAQYIHAVAQGWEQHCAGVEGESQSHYRSAMALARMLAEKMQGRTRVGNRTELTHAEHLTEADWLALDPIWKRASGTLHGRQTVVGIDDIKQTTRDLIECSRDGFWNSDSEWRQKADRHTRY